MSLKAVLFDFNGVIIKDEPIHKRLIEEILIAENLRPQRDEFYQYCLGKSDRACLFDLLTRRGRTVTEASLEQLIRRKSEAYRAELEKLEKLPLFPGLEDLIYKFRVAQVKLAVVTGALRSEAEFVLQRGGLAEYFSVIVAGDEISRSKPDPEGYLLAVERLNQAFPELQLQPEDCLVIEDTQVGIQAAKAAKMRVVGVAHTYPFHMMQRWSNWAVDYLHQLDVERVQEIFTRPPCQIS